MKRVLSSCYIINIHYSLSIARHTFFAIQIFALGCGLFGTSAAVVAVVCGSLNGPFAL